MLHPRLRDDRGFTLIELMVVVLIIAILIAIAIPVFLGLRSRAQDRSAQQSAVIAAKTARIAARDGGALFRGVTTTTLDAAEPSLTFVDQNANSTGPDVISIEVLDSEETFVGAVESESGRCFLIRARASGMEYADGVPPGGCDASMHPSMTFGAGW